MRYRKLARVLVSVIATAMAGMIKNVEELENNQDLPDSLPASGMTVARASLYEMSKEYAARLVQVERERAQALACAREHLFCK